MSLELDETSDLWLQEATAHMNLGAMLHFNGKLEEAEQSYLMALKLKPDDAITRTNLNKLRNLIHKNGGARWRHLPATRARRCFTSFWNALLEYRSSFATLRIPYDTVVGHSFETTIFKEICWWFVLFGPTLIAMRSFSSSIADIFAMFETCCFFVKASMDIVFMTVKLLWFSYMSPPVQPRSFEVLEVTAQLRVLLLCKSVDGKLHVVWHHFWAFLWIRFSIEFTKGIWNLVAWAFIFCACQSNWCSSLSLFSKNTQTDGHLCVLGILRKMEFFRFLSSRDIFCCLQRQMFQCQVRRWEHRAEFSVQLVLERTFESLQDAKAAFHWKFQTSTFGSFWWEWSASLMCLWRWLVLCWVLQGERIWDIPWLHTIQNQHCNFATGA